MHLEIDLLKPLRYLVIYLDKNQSLQKLDIPLDLSVLEEMKKLVLTLLLEDKKLTIYYQKD